jgi:hypothetical protein
MNKREIVKQAIEAGGATKESLMEAAKVNDKGLASLLTYLRWSGTCPIKGEDGVYKLITAEEWEEIKSARGTAGPQKFLTSEERLEKAIKRTARAASALDKTSARLKTDPEDKLLDLQNEKAMLELQISELLEGRAEKDAKDNPTPVTDAQPILEENPEEVPDETENDELETEAEDEDEDDELETEAEEDEFL